MKTATCRFKCEEIDIDKESNEEHVAEENEYEFYSMA